jgi:hypothetical protein
MQQRQFAVAAGGVRRLPIVPVLQDGLDTAEGASADLDPACARCLQPFAAAAARQAQKGMIDNPVGKAKSVVLTDEGLSESERLFRKLFERSAA